MPFVLGTIWPCHLPIPIHVTTLPLANILTAINKGIMPLTIHFVSSELPLIEDASARFVCALAMLAAVKKLSFVPCTIRPFFGAFPTLLIHVPVTVIRTAVHMGVLAPSMSTILVPFSFIFVSISGNEDAITLRA